MHLEVKSTAAAIDRTQTSNMNETTTSSHLMHSPPKTLDEHKKKTNESNQPEDRQQTNRLLSRASEATSRSVDQIRAHDQYDETLSF
jgi:hypothetical protein